MIVASIRHVRTGQAVPVLKLEDGSTREEISVKDAMGMAIRAVAKAADLDPMQVMTSPHWNRFMLVLESKEELEETE